MKIEVFKLENFNDLFEIISNALKPLTDNAEEIKKQHDSEKRSKKVNKPKEVSKPSKAEMEADDINTYKLLVLNSMARKKGWSIEDVNKWMYKLSVNYPAQAVSIALTELSRILDEKYEGTINTCDTIFIISTIDGKIYEISSKKVKSFRNIAAFRTMEDAEFAKKVVGIRKLFRSGQSKQKD